MATLLRLLIIAGIIWLVYSFIKRALNNSSQQLKEQQQTPLPTPMMQQCAHCGVHITKGESTQAQGLFFCSEAHRDTYLQHKK